MYEDDVVKRPLIDLYYLFHAVNNLFVFILSIVYLHIFVLGTILPLLYGRYNLVI